MSLVWLDKCQGKSKGNCIVRWLQMNERGYILSAIRGLSWFSNLFQRSFWIELINVPKSRWKKKNSYWVRCPACGRRVVKKELMKKGCYVCGWQKTQSKKPDSGPYRINCPGCGVKVVREELLKKGCYICGYKLRRG